MQLHVNIQVYPWMLFVFLYMSPSVVHQSVLTSWDHLLVSYNSRFRLIATATCNKSKNDHYPTWVVALATAYTIVVNSYTAHSAISILYNHSRTILSEVPGSSWQREWISVLLVVVVNTGTDTKCSWCLYILVCLHSYISLVYISWEVPKLVYKPPSDQQDKAVQFMHR